MAAKKSTTGNGAVRPRAESPSPVVAAPATPASARAVVAADVAGAEPASEEHPAALETETQPSVPFHVVGIGASAGGFESFSHLFRRLPRDTGMAFVLVQHLDPTHESLLAELLGRTTAMTVTKAVQDTPLAPDHVYVVPHDAMLVLEGGRLRLHPRPPQGRSMLVDSLFRSLARDLGPHALGVVLSGMGSDGTLDLEAIKAAGGITLVESGQTAGFEGMPRSAASGGNADLVLPIEELADELAAIGRQIRAGGPSAARPLAPTPEHAGQLKQIFAVLRAARGVDFTHYRQRTIERRILRRMVLLRLASLGGYVGYLHERPAEVEALYQDLLIKVTQFFRDAALFGALTTTVLPTILGERVAEAPLRIWVPGCSTGEEAYSLAICLQELLGERGLRAPVQIFATDISELAVEQARAGLYPASISLDVSAERLRRFFVRAGDRYRVSEALRESCVFAQHDLTRDPPFARMDLISCRNLLIYLEPALHKKILPRLQYALNPGGFLALGASETAGAFPELFTPVDGRGKVYRRSATPSRMSAAFARAPAQAAREPGRAPSAGHAGPATATEIQKEADRVVMTRYAPAGVVINVEGQILQFRGKTGPYLEPASGDASLNVIKMARQGLALELRGAIQKARRSGGSVRADGLQLAGEGGYREVALEVVPLHGGSEGDPSLPHKACFLVVFQETSGPTAEPLARGSKAKGAKAPAAGGRADRLQQELAATKAHLQAIIEDHEATNEELQAANEEVLSSNEELQSINEELQTAKEELQSTNEELYTVNDELEVRNADLSRVNDDLGNLFSTLDLPVLMLTSDLRIRRFTATAEKMLQLIPSDVGRPLADLQPRIDAPDLGALVSEVIRGGASREREVRDREGRWYSLCIRPYRKPGGKVDGAVLFLVDIDALKRAPAATA